MLCVVVALTLIAGMRAHAAPFAAVVMDARTGQVLHSVNPNARLHPASLTKMMTLYVAFEAIQNGEISLDTMVRISARAANEPPSRLGLRAGQRIALRHLIRAAALRSGNDAATAIAEAVSGSVDAFAQRMNRTAAAIGMSHTNFRNAHGLTQSGHMSSARDMTLLGRQLYFDYPQYYNIFSRRSEDAGIARVSNTNSRFLDGYRGADGIKTGYTNAAGYNLTAMAERGGVRVIVTVFGGRSVIHRHEQVVALMDRGFRAAPNRAAVRRPSRPDYSRPTPQVAAATTTRENPSAGRVIRLQTAPARSLVPQRRPGQEAAPSEELIVSLQAGIDAALAEVASPAAPEAPTAAAAQVMRSLQPPSRPQEVVALALAGQADLAGDTGEALIAADVEAARAAGFSVISTEMLEAVTSDPAVIEVAAQEAEGEAGGELPDAVAMPAPMARPADLVAEALAEIFETDAPSEGAEAPLLAEGAAPASDGSPVPDFSTTELAAVQVTEGMVSIPGLPPIPLPDPAALPVPGAATEADWPEASVELASLPDLADLPVAQTGPTPGLVVTPEGQILWRDEDLLQGIDELAPQVVGPSPILLTTDDSPGGTATAAAPEVVVRVSSSGSQLWAVDLGRYGSRFDAERTLLRVALAEGATLGGGVRRVVPRGGGFGAEILSLTQEQADRACQRLAASAQNCAVVAP